MLVNGANGLGLEGFTDMNKISIIEWIDSSIQNSEVGSSEFPKPVTILSVGFIVKEMSNYIVLARDDMGEGTFRGLLAIPKIVIVQPIKDLAG
jgi:hypothetical protein